MTVQKYVLAIDVGSTTTKAILFGPKQAQFRLLDWAGAPTTVEKPHEDVMVGITNALFKLETKTGRRLLEQGNIIKPAQQHQGVDIFVATSSAGGGLQMLVTGVIKKMTAESASKAALGAGAIVMDVLAIDDGRTDLEHIQRIQQLRPDMVLLSGGVDGGNVTHVASMAELIALARPTSRLGSSYSLPVVYAGNTDARPEVDKFLSEVAAVHHVDNIRPVLEWENLEPASEKIQQLFLEHVMSQAPGYQRLVKMTWGQIMPTPNAVGELLQTIAKTNDINALAVDIGGATTDVFSSILAIVQEQTVNYMKDEINYNNVSSHNTKEERKFHRSVDANLGMSYSIGNVLAEAGGQNILRWLPFDLSEGELRDILSNKMIHPTILPQTEQALLIEHAVAREAMRLSIMRHKLIAAGLSGVHIRRSINDIFAQDNLNTESLIQMMDMDIIIGSGGVLSHAPNRKQALSMMLDAFQPEGVTEIYVDSIFMMPHLGVMAHADIKDIFTVLKQDCLIALGTCIAPVGPVARKGKKLAEVQVDFSQGKVKNYEIRAGELECIALETGKEAIAKITPAYGYDCGEGKGKPVEALLTGGIGGIILDGRGRPITMPQSSEERIALVKKWLKTLDVYPQSIWEVL